MESTIASLRIQVCPEKGINPTILFWGWDWDHQTYSREWYGSLGENANFGYLTFSGIWYLVARKKHTYRTRLRKLSRKVCNSPLLKDIFSAEATDTYMIYMYVYIEIQIFFETLTHYLYQNAKQSSIILDEGIQTCENKTLFRDPQNLHRHWFPLQFPNYPGVSWAQLPWPRFSASGAPNV